MRTPSPYDEIARCYALEYAAWTSDVDFFLRRLPPGTGPVLELGCGSGRVSLPIARNGHRVVGLDLSTEMLSLARAQATREGVPAHFEEADIATFSLGERFRAILMPFSIFSFLPSASARASCLEACARHLAPGGVVLVDHFVPDLATLARGETPPTYRKTFRDPEGPAIINKFEASRYEPSTGRLLCEERYEVYPFYGPAQIVSGVLSLAVLFPEEMTLLFERHGLVSTARYGGYHEEPFLPTSARHLFQAEML